MRADEAGTGAFRVLMTTGVFEPGFRGGGPIRSIAQIVDTAPADMEVLLVTRDRDVGCDEPYPGLSGSWVQRGRARVFYLNPRSARQWIRLFRDLRPIHFDLMYTNSFWAPTTTAVPVLAARLRAIHVSRILVAPRGELSDGALTVKALKKRALLPWWRRLLTLLDVAWHATAPHEMQDIRRLFPSSQIQIVPNQTALPLEPMPPCVASAKHARMVYISRIAANKKLHVALEALRQVSEPIDLDIYGPVEDSRYWARCQSVVATLPDNVRVAYRGQLEPTAVRQTFARYDAFVFPTDGENFGHAIAESLSASCPVICTNKTPWTQVLKLGGGSALFDSSVDEFGPALRTFSSLSAPEREHRRTLAARAYRDWRQQVPALNVLEVSRAKATGVSS